MYFKSIKKYIGIKFLSGDLKKNDTFRNKKAFNLSDAKSILIVIEIKNQDDIEMAKKYVGYFKELKKKVKVVGYVDQETLPEFNYSKIEFDLFAQKELNWYLKPLGFLSGALIQEEFDLLIDLNISNCLPLKFITILSKSRFKVGLLSNQNNSYLDLLIDISTNHSVDFLFRQALIYLNMINNNI